MARLVLTTDHVHDHAADWRGFVPPDENEENQTAAIVGLVAQLYDAVLDDCQPCRQGLLALLAEDPATTGILVHWACLITAETYGDLPEVLVEGSEPADAPFHPSAPFRTLAQVYEDNWGTRSVHEAMRSACAVRSPQQRLEAAETALELVIGLANGNVDFLYQ
ncbi:hypothetical protein OIE69_43595 (plasmid) [Actinacidiphila glaucinigra]|uniref:hypothetical protein n=1 Tax=Actinacidiphila glaucinigra TaxID=235986 RepID=UPI002DD991D6|nr:hypothetical protein [Actinacidiphila glaucinigra]WSD65794.1 hypothetical protein OIE69_43595 [Actinacidiphila glaucinigra]